MGKTLYRISLSFVVLVWVNLLPAGVLHEVVMG